MATYYVDATSGSNNNDGLSPGSAWSSVEFVNNHTFKPGDVILFHRGDVYESTLVPSSSGTADNPITYGAYGSGENPVFTGGEDVTNASWSKGSGNVWSIPVPDEGSFDTENVWFNGKSGNPESSTLGGVDQPGDWYWDAGKLYVYSTSDPSTAFDKVEVNVRDYGIKINGVDYVRIENIEVTQARQNVLIQNSTGSQLVDLEVHQSVRDGILLKEANNTLIQGGSSHDNGVDGTSSQNTHLGHGVLISTNAANNTVSGMKLYNNAEDGVQFGNTAGSGNKIIDNVIYGNREDGIDIKNGSHSFTGNEIYANKENAILVHNTAGTQTLTNNILKTQDSGNPLDVSSGAKVISSGNWYEAVNSQTLHLQSTAASGSTFQNDTFANGGASIKVSVAIQGGTGHTFDNCTFVMHNSGHAIKVEGSAKAAITDSIIYGHGGDLISAPSSSLSLDHNTYWDVNGGTWFSIGGSSQGSSWASSVDGRAIIADPKFVDCMGEDFRLNSGSPATGCGSSAVAGGGTPAPGPNVVDGTAGADTITTGATVDEIRAGGGNDTVKAGDGNDTLYGDAGDDALYGENGNDALYGGDGHDNLVGGAGDDQLTGGAGNDTVVFGPASGKDVVKDFVLSADKVDLSGWSGETFASLIGRAVQSGADTVLNFADGSQLTLQNIALTQLTTAHFIGLVQPQPQPNVVNGTANADTITTGATADEIHAAGGNDTVKAGDGNDALYGDGGNDVLYGENGNDKLYGGDGADKLIGGAGDDQLTGGSGVDTFVFGPGSGSDTVTDFTIGTDKIDLAGFAGETYSSLMSRAVGSSAGTVLNFADGSRMTLENVTPTQLTATQFVGLTPEPQVNVVNGTSSANTITTGATTDEVHAAGGNDTVKAGDGNDALYGDGGNDALYGENGNDKLYGGDGADKLIGGAGDDQLTGGSGVDTFVFGPGSGSDTVTDFIIGTDKIDLTAFTSETYSSVMGRAVDTGADTVLNFADGSRITLQNVDKAALGDASFVFTPPPAGGGSSLPDINGKTYNGSSGANKYNGGTLNDAINGNGGNDQLYGNGGDDIVNGGSGNDVVKGGNGNDWMYGGDGNDKLYGDSGNDVLNGGAGDDWLFGRAGADTFVFDRGCGSDKIKDYEAGIDEIDLSAFGLANVADFLDSGVNKNGNAIFDLGGGDQIEFTGISVHQIDAHDIIV